MLIFLGIFLTGLQLGATACAISCMPIMTPILLSNVHNKKDALQILWKYFSGKLSAYTFLSVISFYGANVFKIFFSDILFTQISALLIIFLGIFLLFRIIFSKKYCSTSCSNDFKYGYFGIGFFSSFSFCLPVVSLMSISSLASSLYVSLSYGIIFGLGVIIIPFLFFYFFIFKITSAIFSNFKKYQTSIEIFSATLLIIIGFMIFFHIIKL